MLIYFPLISKNMDTAYLDKLVEENQSKLIPLADATILSIIEGIPRFFKEPHNSVDYYRRSRDLNPLSPYSPWNHYGRLAIKGVQSDRYALYIIYSSKTVNNDTVFVDLSTKGTTAKYVFIPEIGLYLHEESPRWVQEKLLVLAK